MDFVELASGAIGNIEIREGSDQWGPFFLDLANGMPTDESIMSVEVMAYAGKATEKTDLTTLTEITDLLLEADQVSVSGDSAIVFRLQHPGATYRGSKASLKITITLNGGGVFPFFFYPITIK